MSCERSKYFFEPQITVRSLPGSLGSCSGSLNEFCMFQNFHMTTRSKFIEFTRVLPEFSRVISRGPKYSPTSHIDSLSLPLVGPNMEQRSRKDSMGQQTIQGHVYPTFPQGLPEIFLKTRVKFTIFLRLSTQHKICSFVLAVILETNTPNGVLTPNEDRLSGKILKLEIWSPKNASVTRFFG